MAGIFSNAQIIGQDYILDPDYTPLMLKSQYIPNSSTPIKYISINIHFMLKNDGTGNFTETSDGIDPANNYNGYKFAEDIIQACGQLLANNVEMRYQPTPPVEALETKYSYYLNGVFFHRNTTDYEASYSPCGFLFTARNDYAENVGEALNIFFGKEHPSTSCTYFGGYVVNQHGHRVTYENYINNNYNWWYYLNLAETINHEIGHNFALLHTIRHSCGACCDSIASCNGIIGYCDDGCDDTPTWQEIYASGISDPCCWNGCSNNLMDYGADTDRALTPFQLGKIHQHIEELKKDYKTCSYKYANLNITNFTNNKAYIAETITIPSNTSITVSDNKGLFILTEEFEVNGQLEIEAGSIFVVNTASSNCQ